MIRAVTLLTVMFLAIAAGGYALALVITQDNRLIDWVADLFNMERFLEMEQANYIAALVVLNVIALGASGILALILTVLVLRAFKNRNNQQSYQYQQDYQQPYEYQQGYQSQYPRYDYEVSPYELAPPDDRYRSGDPVATSSYAAGRQIRDF